ncbi:MAG TPA: carboxylesterase family protein [Draconibacterium sp.]|nr:carboxylesterase family protein [Draconibacterium sp.]
MFNKEITKSAQYFSRLKGTFYLQDKRFVIHLIVLTVFLLQPLTGWMQTTPSEVSGDPVKTKKGLIAGKLLPNGVKVYFAIPYAQPPVGELRWREPQPVKPWEGVLTADNYCAPCAQNGNNSSEDCLYLNVWTPVNPKSKNMPVVVYIHGGAFVGGSASPSGEVLAAKGVVYVNFNYRLGVFGNLVHPELNAESPYKTSGNYAHLDQVAALQWIHNNISRFGGNPNNVTLMGQSSGGIDVCYNQASPLTKGLIHKVVALSGANFSGGPWIPRSQEQLAQEGLAYQNRLNCNSIEEMRALSIQDLLKEVNNKALGEPGAADGYVLPESPMEIFAAKKQNKVPAILCTCRDESGGVYRTVKTVSELEEKVRSTDDIYADEILDILDISGEEDLDESVQTLGFALGAGKQMVIWAEHQVASKSPVYFSLFSHGERSGHGADIEYWIGNVMNKGRTQADRELADQMSDALVAFTKTGNPNTEAIQWPEYTADKPTRLVLDNTLKTQHISEKAFKLIDHPEYLLDTSWGNTRGEKK